MQAILKTNPYELCGKLGVQLRRFLFSILAMGPIPTHIAFIMDGNRRYARKHNLKEGAGHRVGFLALKSMMKYCYELGVKYITVYAFSIDNFKRRPEEVESVMDLMQEKIEELLKEESLLNTYGVRIYFIGNLRLLSEHTRLSAEKAMRKTAKNDKVALLVCVAYTSTDEIVHAVQQCCIKKRKKLQELDSSGSENDPTSVTRSRMVSEHTIRLSDLESHMYMSVAPDVDILVRTSGANRLSNFLLWQSTYSYLYAPSALWPEISLWHLVWMVLNFQLVLLDLEKHKKQH